MEFIGNNYNPGYWLDTREKLGQGRVTKCKVFKGYPEDEDDEDVAIKRFPLTYQTQEETFRRECEVMKALSGTCSSLVSMRESFRENENDVGYICMEYCEKGDLHQYLQQNGGTLSPPAAKYIFYGTAVGLQSMHARGIYHCDVTPRNIFLTEHRSKRAKAPWVKLGDFGVSRMPYPYSYYRRYPQDVPPGIIAYMPPEMLFKREATEKTDIFSLGLVLYEMMSGQRPWLPNKFRESDFKRFYEWCEDDAPIGFPDNASTELCDLIEGMLRLDPEWRYGWDEIKESVPYRSHWRRMCWY